MPAFLACRLFLGYVRRTMLVTRSIRSWRWWRGWFAWRSMVPSLGAAVLVGCMADPQDARMRVPGEYIGTFEVRAALTDSMCGPGIFEAAGLWEFEVQLSNDKDCLYWNSGKNSVCSAQSSNRETFSFKSKDSWTLLETKPGRPNCVI